MNLSELEYIFSEDILSLVLLLLFDPPKKREKPSDRYYANEQ